MTRMRSRIGRIIRRLPSSRLKGVAATWRDFDRLREADVALVSFPKSGRTFVRTMLARLYQQQFGIDEREVLEFKTLRNAEPHVPRLLLTHDGDAMRRPHQIRINRKAYADTKVLLLVRHPGDVIVSRYHHHKHRSTDKARQRLARQPIDQYVWSEQGGVPAIVAFLNNWAEYARERDDLMIVRYRDFLQEPHETLSKVAAFIGLSASPDTIAEAVEFARFDNLKQREREGYFKSERFGARGDGNESSFKVRSGSRRGYLSALEAGNATRLDAYVRANLDPVFGYATGD